MPWDVPTELLAQLLEEVSKLTGEKPLQVDRPWLGEGRNGQRPNETASPPRSTDRQAAAPNVREQGIHTTPTGGVVANGMLAMIEFAAGEGNTVRSGNSE